MKTPKGLLNNDEARIEFVLKLRARGLRDTNVLRALETVPRELFVPRRYADLAGKDIALPIGCGQTMPSPFDVARMVGALDVQSHHRILEIGTGSGYTTAILASLAEEIVSIERYNALALEAKTRLKAFGLANVEVHWADGLALPPELGFFDRILVHGLVDKMPPPLLGALSVGGIIVGARTVTDLPQPLLAALTRDGQGHFAQSLHGPIRATPLVEGVSRGL